MKELSFYDFAGVLAPGSLVLFGLAYFVPGLSEFRSVASVQLGGLGIFVAMAYVAGHLTQAVGNLVEAVYWKIFGGMPTSWVLKRQLLAPSQLTRLDALTASRWEAPLKVDVPRSAWNSCVREMYSAVAAAGRSGRIDTFNAIYGLLRGIAAGTVILGVAAFITRGLAGWRIEVPLSIITVVALYRMHRFAVHYARELYVECLHLQDRTAPPK